MRYRPVLVIVVSRCRGIGPPSGIPSSGLCFCWLPIFVVIQPQTSASQRARLTTPIYENPSRRLATSPNIVAETSKVGVCATRGENKRPLPTGSRTPDSRCCVEDNRPLCQLSSKRLKDNWQSDLLSSTKRGDGKILTCDPSQGMLALNMRCLS